MEWEFIAPMIMTVVLILTVGGVMVLRPIAKRIGDLLELYAKDRREGLEGDVSQVRDLLETMNARLHLMEERQDFTERLLTGKTEKTDAPGGMITMRILNGTAVALIGLSLTAAPLSLSGQEGDVYRTLTVQAAPGQLLELIELVREERAFLTSLGEEPPLWMRHSQGDIWDLFLLYPVGSMADYFASDRVGRRAEAAAPSGRSGAELQREIDARTAWREEVFVRGPAVGDVKDAWAGAGYFHVEMFEGLAGKRMELLRERDMENDYLVRLGRAPNHVFTRIAGSSTDAYTIGYYESLKAYANPPEVTAEQEDEAAVAAGFRGAAYIGSYLRELILRHHDTLATPIPG